MLIKVIANYNWSKMIPESAQVKYIYTPERVHLEVSLFIEPFFTPRGSTCAQV
jgi:hypothetical protein